MRHFLRIGTAALCSLVSVSAASASELEVFQTAMQSQDYESGYHLGLALQTKFAGNPEFDFMFAQAAYAQGFTDQAIFALERVLWVNPNNSDARNLLAELYLVQQAYTFAQIESNTVIRSEPAPQAYGKAQQINTVAARYYGGSNGILSYGSLSVELGHDSNPEQSPSRSSSAFRKVSAEVGGEYLLSTDTGLKYELSLGQRTNSQTNIDGKRFVAVSGSFTHQATSSVSFGFDIGGQKTNAGNDPERNRINATLHGQFDFAEPLTISPYVKLQRINSETDDLDRTLKTFGLQARYGAVSSRSFDIFGSVYFQTSQPETPSVNNSVMTDFQSRGAVIGARMYVNRDVTLTSRLQVQSYDFSGAINQSPGGALRHDQTTEASAVMDYRIDETQKIAVGLKRTRNTSNTASQEFGRTEYSITYTYRFGG